MKHSKWLDVIVGLFVLGGILSFFWMALNITNLESYNQSNAIVVTAEFDNIGSLKVKAPITLAGVKVGKVSRISINPENYEALVEMTINTIPLPKDSSVSILTAGLVGEQYIAIEPGGDPKNLATGDKIKIAQSALVLEKLIGQFLTSMGKKE